MLIRKMRLQICSACWRTWVEDDGLALIVQIVDQGAEQASVHRIRAAEGLVEDDQFGVVDDGGEELDLLLHALGELPQRFFSTPGSSTRSSHSPMRSFRMFRSTPLSIPM